MIACPICHVMNDDIARFCAECGQRLGASPSQPAASAPEASPPSEPSRGPGVKLHSPLLGDNEPPMPERADFSRLRARDNPPAPASGRGLRSPLLNDQQPADPPARPGGKPGHLHSPLLEGDDGMYDERPTKQPGKGRSLKSPLLGGEPDYPEYNERPAAPGKSRGLHSPLLGGSEPDYPQYDERPAGKGRGLHSPLLGDSKPGPSDYEDHSAPSSRPGHLRSPLLGGSDAEPDYDAPAKPRPLAGGAARRPGALHSPLLGDDHGYAAEPEFIEEDDPNVLRSPLLAAKVPLSDRPAAKNVRMPEPAPPPQPVARNEAQPYAVPEAFNRPAASPADARAMETVSRPEPAPMQNRPQQAPGSFNRGPQPQPQASQPRPGAAGDAGDEWAGIATGPEMRGRNTGAVSMTEPGQSAAVDPPAAGINMTAAAASFNSSPPHNAPAQQNSFQPPQPGSVPARHISAGPEISVSSPAPSNSSALRDLANTSSPAAAQPAPKPIPPADDPGRASILSSAVAGPALSPPSPAPSPSLHSSAAPAFDSPAPLEATPKIRKRGTPKLLADSDDNEVEVPMGSFGQDRFAPGAPIPAPAAPPAFLKILIAPLAAAALFKVWLISQYLSQWQVAADQAAQFIGIVTLIIICATSGRRR